MSKTPAEKKLTFILTQEEADLIVRSLGEAPYKITAKLIGNMQMQYQKQTIPVEEVEKDETENSSEEAEEN